MPEARSVSVFLRAFTSQYQAAMAKASATMQDFGATAASTGASWTSLGKRTQNVGREMSRVGSTLTRNVTLPLALLGAGSIKTAIDFESAFAGVRKTIDATEAQYRELERGIQDMAERLPASVEEISAVAEAAGQLGIQRESILSFTETMIDLGETTNLSADVAANALARFANITGMSSKNFERLGSTLVDLGNKGAATEAEIAEMSLRIAGAGTQVGLTEAQILGFAESLSSVGIDAEMGGSAISRTFITMANDVAEGGKALEGFAQVAGTTTAAFKTQFEDDAAGAMISFIEGLSRVKEEGGNVFQVLEDLGLGEIRVRDSLLRAAGASDIFAKSQRTANKEWSRSNALSKESEKRYETNAAKLEVLKNKFRNIAATFGNDLMPVLKDVAEALSDAAKWFGSLSEEQRKNIIKWAGIAMVAGPVLRIFGGLVTAIGTIIRTGGAAASVLGKILASSKTAPVPTKGVPPVAGAAGGLALPVAGAVVVTAASVAAQKKLLDELGISLTELGVIGQSLELLPGIGPMLRNTRLLQELDEAKEASGELATAQEMVAVGLFDTVEAAEAYRNVSDGAIQATKRQRQQLAGLVGALDDVGHPIDANTQSMVNNLLRMGDWRSALKLLQGELDDSVPKIKNQRDNIDDAAESAADHEQKVRGMSSALRGVPPKVDTQINVRGIDPVLAGLRAVANALASINGSVATATVRTVQTGYANQRLNHSGGAAGTGAMRYGPGRRSDEFPTILQKGEGVSSTATMQLIAKRLASPAEGHLVGEMVITNWATGQARFKGQIVRSIDAHANHEDDNTRTRQPLFD